MHNLKSYNAKHSFLNTLFNDREALVADSEHSYAIGYGVEQITGFPKALAGFKVLLEIFSDWFYGKN